ncbi:ROK family transcriptional regulator [Rarobacter incanus]|uniref:Putative NBD/HSP70 family sugar kinase n=1 Tax=Rarobacter incanus TaxID=153494 RepID=A0A542SPH6_9MICO|nr:ROK family transcriptional regulator [Rarobacter incanus]TQK76520.1 putative NBD/HSP70 family sugar kinase [Rarobacter incanus]
MEVEDSVGSRLRNRQLALEFIRRTGGCSRSEIMRELGLSRSGVNHLVSALLDEGIIETQTEGPEKPARRGRPSTYLVYRGESGHVAGLDYGHGHVTVAIANLNGEVLAESTARVDVDHDPSGAMEVGKEVFDGLVAQVGGPQIQHVVVGIPGPIDPRTGLMRVPTVLAEWRGLSPQAEFERVFGLPVTMSHDAMLGAYGESTRGAARGLSNVLYIKVSGGVGAAMILNGRPYMGTSGLAGEIGHAPLQGSTELCRCGNRGCLESVVSADTIRRQLGLSAGREFAADSFDVREVTDAAGVRILSEAGWTLGRLLADLCNCLNPQRVVLGGALGAYSSTFLQGVEQSIARYAQPGVIDDLTVVHSQLTDRSEIVGAVMLAAERAAQLVSLGVATERAELVLQ